MRLTDEQQSWIDGAAGRSIQWAMTLLRDLGDFMDAPRMVPVASCHFGVDIRMSGQYGADLLQEMVDEGVEIRVPGYLDPCAVDFERVTDLMAYGLSAAFIEADREAIRQCRVLGFLPTQTCIPYQTVVPPRFGEHLAWGDTGAVACANALFGARANFEGAPSCLASGLTGITPAYGFHQDTYRAANLHIRLDCEPAEIADWGAIAAWTARIGTGYETVPVFTGDFPPPSFAMLKQLGVALSSCAGHAMFHVVGATPEARSLEAACAGRIPAETHVINRAELDAEFTRTCPDGADADVVVFAAPQLGIDEVKTIAERLDGRRVHENTRLILAIDLTIRRQAEAAGLKETLDRAGAEFFTGACFYLEAPLMREATGWNTIVTNSSKMVNALSPSGYTTALRRLDACLDAAVAGRLVQ